MLSEAAIHEATEAVSILWLPDDRRYVRDQGARHVPWREAPKIEAARRCENFRRPRSSQLERSKRIADISDRYQCVARAGSQHRGRREHSIPW